MSGLLAMLLQEIHVQVTRRFNPVFVRLDRQRADQGEGRRKADGPGSVRRHARRPAGEGDLRRSRLQQSGNLSQQHADLSK